MNKPKSIQDDLIAARKKLAEKKAAPKPSPSIKAKKGKKLK